MTCGMIIPRPIHSFIIYLQLLPSAGTFINEISVLGKSENKSKIGKIIECEVQNYENQSAADFLNLFHNTNAGPLKDRVGRSRLVLPWAHLNLP